MNTSITVTGFVATVPKHTITSGKVPITSFRVGVSERRFERATGTWSNTETSWLSVSCFRYLAVNAYASLSKGDPVVVTGRLRVRAWESGGKSGTDVEIEADSLGHDLNWGKSGFTRPAQQAGASVPGAATPGATASGASEPSVRPDADEQIPEPAMLGASLGASAISALDELLGSAVSATDGDPVPPF